MSKPNDAPQPCGATSVQHYLNNICGTIRLPGQPCGGNILMGLPMAAAHAQITNPRPTRSTLSTYVEATSDTINRQVWIALDRRNSVPFGPTGNLTGSHLLWG